MHWIINLLTSVATTYHDYAIGVATTYHDYAIVWATYHDYAIRLFG